MRMLRVALLGIVGMLTAMTTRAEMTLVMVEQPGCVYCKAWDTQISAIYPRTAEGMAAPLIRVQLRDPLPDGINLDRPAAFTPTFVLLRDGTEVGRIEGYPGEDFFWGLLGQMIDAQGPLPVE